MNNLSIIKDLIKATIAFYYPTYSKYYNPISSNKESKKYCIIRELTVARTLDKVTYLINDIDNSFYKSILFYNKKSKNLFLTKNILDNIYPQYLIECIDKYLEYFFIDIDNGILKELLMYRYINNYAYLIQDELIKYFYVNYYSNKKFAYSKETKKILNKIFAKMLLK